MKECATWKSRTLVHYFYSSRAIFLIHIFLNVVHSNFDFLSRKSLNMVQRLLITLNYDQKSVEPKLRKILNHVQNISCFWIRKKTVLLFMNFLINFSIFFWSKMSLNQLWTWINIFLNFVQLTTKTGSEMFTVRVYDAPFVHGRTTWYSK